MFAVSVPSLTLAGTVEDIPSYKIFYYAIRIYFNREPEQDASTAGTAASASQAGLAGIESIESAFGSRAMNLRDMMRRDGWAQ